jgi:hypothetical protein
LAEWRKSSFSGGQDEACVEVACLPGAFVVRDSKEPDGPTLQFPSGPPSIVMATKIMQAPKPE